MNKRLAELAEQAGFEEQTHFIDSWECGIKELERFAELVRQDYLEDLSIQLMKTVVKAVEVERENCAALCEEQDEYGCGQYAKAIRARGEK
jgi:hypothetical protein